jgi:hypothetical protein
MIRLLGVVAAATTIASAAPDRYCEEKNIQMVDGSIQLARCWNRLFSDDFENGLKGWKIENLGKKLAVEISSDNPAQKFLFITNRSAAGDTAIEAASNAFAVHPG